MLVLPQCDFCVLICRFCTTCMETCKGLITVCKSALIANFNSENIRPILPFCWKLAFSRWWLLSMIMAENIYWNIFLAKDFFIPCFHYVNWNLTELITIQTKYHREIIFNLRLSFSQSGLSKYLWKIFLVYFYFIWFFSAPLSWAI